MDTSKHNLLQRIIPVLFAFLMLAGGACVRAQDAEQAVDAALSDLALEEASAEDFALSERTAAEIERQESLFAESIKAIETDWGPYDGRLVEALLGAGRYSLEIGRYDEAAERFARALSVSRVANGLLNPEQIQILELLVESLSGAGDWKEADDRVHLAFYLQGKLLDRRSEQYARAVIDFAQWKLDGIYNADFRLNDNRELMALEEIYSDLLRTDEDSRRNLSNKNTLVSVQKSEWSAQAKLDLLDQIALTHYTIVRVNLNSPPSHLLFPESPYTYQMVCSTVTNSDGTQSRICGQQRVRNPAFTNQQNERWRFKQELVQRSREFNEVVDAMAEMAGTEPDITLVKGVQISARVEELRALHSQLESSMSSLRGW